MKVNTIVSNLVTRGAVSGQVRVCAVQQRCTAGGVAACRASRQSRADRRVCGARPSDAG